MNKVPKKLILMLVETCYRNNTSIEQLHSGKSLPKKYLSPEYSRITDEEMKKLNKEIVNNVYTFFYLMVHKPELFNKCCSNPYFFPNGWDQPKLNKQFMKGVKILEKSL